MDSGNQQQPHNATHAQPQQPMHQQPYQPPVGYQPQAPRRGDFLSLRLIAAVGISVILAVLSAQGIVKFIHGLTGGTYASQITLLGQLDTQPIFAATALLVLAVLPMLLFKSVRRSLSAEPEFTKRAVYKVTIYTGLSILAVLTAVSLITVVSVLIGSLAFIGSSVGIGALYLNGLLPQLAAGAITGFAAYFLWQTAKGKDMINLLSLVQAIIAGAVAISLIVVLAVAAHKGGGAAVMQSPSTSPSNSSMMPAGPTQADIDKLKEDLNKQYEQQQAPSSSGGSNSLDDYQTESGSGSSLDDYSF